MNQSYLEGYAYYKQGTFYRVEGSLEVWGWFCHILSYSIGTSHTPISPTALQDSTHFFPFSAFLTNPCSIFSSPCLKLLQNFILSFIQLTSIWLIVIVGNLSPLDPLSAVLFLIKAQFLALDRCLVNVYWVTVIFYNWNKEDTCLSTKS